jgi:hypothetical protein
MDALPERVIWIFWDTGYDAAPELVRVCIDSWIIRNPTWKVVVLDRPALANYVGLAELIDGRRRDITIQKHSVLIRVALLQQYGGVWVDATVFCSKPLDTWLGAYLETGFFVFRDPGADRLLSTWFMAARRGNLLIETYHRLLLELFTHTHFSFQDTLPARTAVRGLKKVLNRNTHLTRYWLSWPVRRLLRAHPYFIVHYTFNRMIEDDAACRALFESGKHLQAPLCMRVQELQWQASGVAEALALISRARR